MKTIGLTGGIGSGKSTVASLLEQKGIPVYYADLAGKRIQNEDPEIRSNIISLFGAEMYPNGGDLDRKALANKVFQQPRFLEALNAIVHPATLKDFEKWSLDQKRKGHPLVVKEAAILFEAGANIGLSGIWVVYAPLCIRLERVCLRDGVKESEVMARISRQWPDSEKIPRGDFIFFNDGIHDLGPQLEAAISSLEL